MSSRLLDGGEPAEFLLHVEDELLQALLDDLDFVDLAEAEALAELAVLAAICKVLVELQEVVLLLVELLDGEELGLEELLLLLQLSQLLGEVLRLQLQVGEDGVLLEELLDDLAGPGDACVKRVPVCDLM